MADLGELLRRAFPITSAALARMGRARRHAKVMLQLERAYFAAKGNDKDQSDIVSCINDIDLRRYRALAQQKQGEQK